MFPGFSLFALPRLQSIESIDWRAAGLDLIFCALPHATTQKVVERIFAALPAIKVVDLSADFRLADTAAYARWYGHEHHAPELQRRAVYGLVEVYREADSPGAVGGQPRMLHHVRTASAHPAVAGAGDRPRRL